MNEDCQRYAEDPEGNAAHLAECVKCREMYASLDAPIESQPVRIEALPIAAWEGAGYRSWPLVIGGALALAAVALGLCAAAGISPLAALRAGANFDWRGLLQMADQAVRPLGPIGFSALFIAVNTVLFLLLRRPPRGIDA
jgi:hypothetical protein